MSFYDLLSMSLGNLWRRKLRTCLTVLGVLIGTASIVAMLSLAVGMKSMMMEQVSGMGSATQITVMGSDMYESDEMDEERLLSDSNMEMFASMEHVVDVIPSLTLDVNMKCGKYDGNAYLTGVSHSIMEEQELEEGECPKSGGSTLRVIAGNWIPYNFYYYNGTDFEDYYTTGELPDVDIMNDIKNVIYYDYSAMEEEEAISEEEALTEETFDDTGMDVSMDFVETDNSEKTFRVEVTGLLAGGDVTYGTYSDALIVDIDALKQYLIKNYGRDNIPGQPKKKGKPLNEWVYTSFTIEVDDMENVDSVLMDIQDLGFEASTNKELLESLQKELLIIECVLGGIGMVAFLVAAIGIANTMMMSTYERTKEIGIMKVLGCDMRDILKLFLSEAGFIGLIGGLVGLGFSCGVSYVINMVIQSSGTLSGNISVIPFWLGLVAIGFSTIMGMIAGYFPARRAMKLSPLAAIRTE